MISLLRFVIRWTTLFYLLLLLGLMAALHWRGEKLGLLGLFLYFPQPLLLAPMALLAPVCLLFGLWRTLLAQAACAALLCFLYMTWGFGPGTPAGAADVTVVTWNVGDSNHADVLAFLQAQKPDVVLLQDAFGRGAEILRAHPEWHLTAEGQFVCLTRFPVVATRPLPLPGWNGAPVAMRYELRVKGRTAAFYSVHLPTPRSELRPFISWHPLAAAGPLRVYEAEHLLLARGLAGAISAEKEPLIVVGDFNMPDHGYAYHLFPPLLTDAYARSGHGWGFTFPCDVHLPLTEGPWLRLDYVWCSQAWRPLSSATSPGMSSQHRGVVARLAL